MVLLGLPGTGKSTFVRHLALRMAQAELDRSLYIQDLLPTWQGGALLPVIISLGRLAESLPAGLQKGQAGFIEEYITRSLLDDERLADFAPHCLESIRHSGGLVLFDGLDEVADLRLRPVVVQAVEDFVELYRKNKACRFLVTCRTYSYHHDPHWQLTGWPTFELALLDKNKIEQFVNAWHAELIRIEPSRQADYSRKREKLLASLQPDDRRRLYEIAPFPIILTMMAVVHTHYGELPDTRAQVYEKCVDLILVHWELDRPVTGQGHKTQKRTIVDELNVPRITLDLAIWEVAFKAHEGRSEESKERERGSALVTEDLLTGILGAYFQDLQKVQVFLDYCQSSNGLLMYQGSVEIADAPPGTPPRRVYAFPHLTFEEYLAARYLENCDNFASLSRALFDRSDRWREVVMLLGEYLCFARGSWDRAEMLLNAFSPERPAEPLTAADWRAAWLAGDLLTLYRRPFPNRTASADERIVQSLHNLVEQGALDLRSRAAAADTLDALGGLPKDLFAFIPITHGGRQFAIAKYPVTNFQYARFLQPENFQDPGLWRDLPKYDEHSNPMKVTWGEQGWDWLQRMLKEPGYSPDGRVVLPRGWSDPRFGLARRGAPVVYITWWEACAYCRWLEKHWGELEESRQNPDLQPDRVRLPLEVEWALAAQPPDRYPWDAPGQATKELDRILQRANISESNINRTTPVGMYPLGASRLYGLMDIAGNVWEWQSNFFDKDHDYLALRGGAWLSSWLSARVFARHHPPPVYRWDYSGFRVVVLPKSLVS